MAYQLFDSSIVKVQTDGDVVLSSFLDDGEKLVKSSFAKDETVKPPDERVEIYTVTSATITGSSLLMVLNLPDSGSYPVLDDILADKYRAVQTSSSFANAPLSVNGVEQGTFAFVKLFKTGAQPDYSNYTFDFKSGPFYGAGDVTEAVMSKVLDDYTALRLNVDETTTIN